jgi:hypothetical protein
MSQAVESVDLRAERIREWRDAGDRVLRAYRAWCAATRSDRHELCVYLLDALRREERAAWQVERAASGPGRHRPHVPASISREQAHVLCGPAAAEDEDDAEADDETVKALRWPGGGMPAGPSGGR